MSDKPQEDLLESIISQSMSPEGPDAPPAPDGGKKTNKRTSVYRYLLVLFGAAFVLLLLAYFIQQRSSETTISDLRDSMNLSRAELMEEIDGLRAEKKDLEAQTAELETQLAELQRQMEDEETDSFWREKDLQIQLASWHDLWGLEESFCNKDYEACAQFFRNVYASNYYATPAEAAERVEEIYRALVEMGELNEEDFRLPIVYSE